MEKKNHTLWNHEERFYKVLDKLKEKLDSGAINQEEYDIMREKAIADESDLRRKDIDLLNAMWRIDEPNSDDEVYYQKKIYDFIDELYINCKCKFKDTSKYCDTFDYLVENSNSNNIQFYNICKNIYNDLITNKLDITNITGEKLLEMYGEV